jgi:hypothetical protein
MPRCHTTVRLHLPLWLDIPLVIFSASALPLLVILSPFSPVTGLFGPGLSPLLAMIALVIGYFGKIVVK